MRYKISGRQIDVGEALQTHVRSELSDTVEKYSQRPTDAAIIFARTRTNIAARQRCICRPG